MQDQEDEKITWDSGVEAPETEAEPAAYGNQPVNVPVDPVNALVITTSLEPIVRGTTRDERGWRYGLRTEDGPTRTKG